MFCLHCLSETFGLDWHGANQCLFGVRCVFISLFTLISVFDEHVKSPVLAVMNIYGIMGYVSILKYPYYCLNLGISFLLCLCLDCRRQMAVVLWKNSGMANIQPHLDLTVTADTQAMFATELNARMKIKSLN